MNTRLYKLADMMRNIDEAAAWSQGKFTCFSCHKKGKGYAFKSLLGAICPDCVEKELKKQINNVDVTTLQNSQLTEALEFSGRIRSRLTVLWRFHDVLPLIASRNTQEVEPIQKLLIRNLGYVQEHPLAQHVRQAAFQACQSVGASLVPLLMGLCEPVPWQFYANIIMVLGHIAPQEPGVAAFIQKAAQDQNAEIRKRASVILSRYSEPAAVLPEQTPARRHSTSPKQQRLQTVVNTLDSSLRHLVQIGTTPAPVQKVLFGEPVRLDSASPEERRMEILVDKHYTADSLKRLYKTYLHDVFFSAGSFTVKGNFTIGKLKRTDTLRALAKVFAHKHLFDILFHRFSPPLQEIFQMMVWEGASYEAKQLEKRFDVEIVKPVKKYGYGNPQDIADPFVLFQVRSMYDWRTYHRDYSYTYYLSLADSFRRVFKQYLPTPRGYDLVPTERITPTTFLAENQETACQQVKLYITYINQGNLQYSKSTGKLLKSSLTKMAKYCYIEEFYRDPARKNLEYFKTRLIIDFLQGACCDIEQAPEKIIKQQVLNFFTVENPKGKKLHEFLYHLKGRYYEYNYDKRELRVKKSLQQIVTTLPLSQWIAIDNLERYCFYRDIYLNVIEKRSYGNDLYFNKSYSDSYGGGYERVNITEELYKDALLVPFLKTMMFLFATFGILDIAYDVPENPVLRERDKPYLSPFDGLRYVRLTPLGAYVLGLASQFTSTVRPQSAAITLDENRLFLTIDGADPLKAMILEKMADRINEHTYKVSYQSFLKECSTKEEITQKISMFKEHIHEKPPQLWQEFLTGVLEKVNPLVSKQKMEVFKLKPNKDLIALIARDEVLKRYTLKAEDYHILIEEKHISKVKKRLEKFGYFIDNI